jgi:hypothetical protein
MTLNWQNADLSADGTFNTAFYNFLLPLEVPINSQTDNYLLYPYLVQGNVTVGVGFDFKGRGASSSKRGVRGNGHTRIRRISICAGFTSGGREQRHRRAPEHHGAASADIRG